MSFFGKILGKSQTSKSKKHVALKSRRLGLESLENREMLSVSPLSYTPEISQPTACVCSFEEIPFAESHAQTQHEPYTGSYDIADAFKLNSKADSRYRIYLDFNGFIPNNPADNWNDHVSDYWSLDDDKTSFSDYELASIIEIWMIVSDKFSAFDVNVSTDVAAFDAPDNTLLKKSGANDPDGWGIRVVYGAEGDFGGVAYMGSFDWDRDVPCYVVDYGGWSAATVTVHEVGHTLGLGHDGRTLADGSTEEYYGGHEVYDARTNTSVKWGAVMGSAYGCMEQFSIGDYKDANQFQDDIATITGYIPLRPDKDLSFVQTGGRTVAEGTIHGSGDIDSMTFTVNETKVYSFEAVSGVTIDNTQISSLYYVLTLRNDTTGAVVFEKYSPLDTFSVSYEGELVAGTYTLSITGAGVEPFGEFQGFSDYGSIGKYEIEMFASTMRTPEVRVSGIGGQSVSLEWNTVAGATYYTVQYSADGKNWTTITDITTTSCIVNNLPSSSYRYFRVRAENARDVSKWSKALRARVDDCYEPNDVISSAQDFGVISGETTFSDLVYAGGKNSSGASKYDYYKFTVPVDAASDGKITIRSNGSPHLGIRIYDANQRLMNFGSGTGTEGRMTVDVGALAAGTYYIQVFQRPSWGSWDEDPSNSYNPNYSITFEFAEINNLAKPVISVTSVTHDTVNLKWEPVAGATGYVLQLYNPATGWADYRILGDVDHYNVTGLASGTLYQFRLKATAADRFSSAYSSVVSAMTDTVLAPPVAPLDFRCTEANRFSVKLEWTMQRNLSGYKLEYKKSADSEWTEWTSAPGPNDTSATITGLLPETEYEFRLTAINASGSAEAETSATTASGEPVAPEDFTGVSLLPDSVSLSWTAQPELTSYKLEYKKSADSEWTEWTPDPGPDDTAATITGLEPGTEYDFRLTATNEYGSAASVSVVTTLVPPAPTSPVNLRSTTQTTDSVTLLWASQKYLGGYKLEYKKSSDTSWITFLPAPGMASTTVTVTGLETNTLYDFRLTAINMAGSANSRTAVKTAMPPVPEMPTHVSAVAATGGKTQITWSAVDGAISYDIMGYNQAGDYWWKIGSTTDTSYDAPAYTANVTTIAVHAVNEAGRSKEKTTDILRGPSEVSAVAAPGSRTQISWNAVAGATSYDIMGYNAAGNYWWKIDSTTDTSYVASAYTSNVTTIAIHAIRGDERTMGVSASIFRGPSEVSAVAASGNQTQISWNAVAGATSYEIMGYNKAGNYWWKIGTTSDTSFNTQGFTTNVTTIAIHALRGEERSAGTATSIFRGPESVSAVAAASSTNISWSLVPGATSYEIMGYNAKEKYWWRIGTTTDAFFDAPYYTTNVTTIAVHALRGTFRTAGTSTTIVR